jgi:multiple sugar transport system substrate-binding protein
MKIQTKQSIIAALVIFGLLVSGCASQATPKPAATAAPATAAPVTINVWLMPLVEDDATELKPFIQDFEQKNPGILVNLTIIPWSGSLQAQVTAFKGGAGPDVYYTAPGPRIETLVSIGALEPLDAYADAAYKAKLNAGLLDSGYWQNHLYGVPFTAYGRALYYNIDEFKKAGITNPPTNWDEFRADAKAVTGNGVYGFALSGTDQYLDDYHIFLHQWGGDFLSADGKKCAVNSDAGIAAFSFLVDMATKDKSMYPGSGAASLDTTGLFASGSTAMWIQSNYLAKLKTEAPNLNYGTAKIPQYGHGNQPYGEAASEWLSMASDSKHKDAAWKFLEYYSTDPDFQLKHNQDISFLPVIPMPNFPITDPRMDPFVFDTTLKPSNVIMDPKGPEMDDALKAQLNRAFLGEISVTEALDTACIQIDTILKAEYP